MKGAWPGLLAAVALAGCYRGGGASGECEIVCLDDDECPAGLVCGLAGRCVGMRAASCEGAGLDGGGGMDAPTDARLCLGPDEDGDGVVDACDPCPFTSPGGEGDADGDGVGDRCDPRDAGGAGQERLVLFDGFRTGSRWSPELQGQWAIQQSGTGQASTLDLGVNWLRWTVPVGVPDSLLVAARVRVMEVTSPGPEVPWIGVGRGLAGGTSPELLGQVCRVELPNATTSTAADVLQLPLDVLWSDPLPSLMVGQPFVLAAWWTLDGGLECRIGAIAETQTPIIVHAANVSPPPGPTTIGVVASGARVVVDWVMAVESVR